MSNGDRVRARLRSVRGGTWIHLTQTVVFVETAITLLVNAILVHGGIAHIWPPIVLIFVVGVTVFLGVRASTAAHRREREAIRRADWDDLKRRFDLE